jgi:glycosyltransferase involved in cell wall biosynthesis
MEISIAMSTFNGERFIREQLDSLQAQTLPPFELVVGDDGSTDRTLEILNQFASEARFPVRVQRNTRCHGFSENFLQTAKRCRGDWIAFCDQDDIWLPRKLARLMEVVGSDSEIVFAAHRATMIDEGSNPIGRFSAPPVERLATYRALTHRLWQTPSGFTQIFRRFLVQDFASDGRPPTSHDQWVFWLANVMGRTAYLPDQLVLYRRHQTNASRLTSPIDLATELADSARHTSYEGASRRVDEFSAYLSGQTQNLKEPARERFEVAAKVYARLARNLRQRAVIWNPRQPLGIRLGVWANLLVSGGYGSPRTGGVGWRSAGKDFARMAWLMTARRNGEGAV